MEDKNRYPVAVIGDFDSVIPFATIGFDVFYENQPHPAGVLLKKLVREGRYAIIFLVEPLYVTLTELIQSFGDRMFHWGSASLAF